MWHFNMAVHFPVVIVEGNAEGWMLEIEFITLIFLHLCLNCELQWAEGEESENGWLWIFRNGRGLVVRKGTSVVAIPRMPPVLHVQSRERALEFPSSTSSCLCPTLI